LGQIIATRKQKNKKCQIELFISVLVSKFAIYIPLTPCNNYPSNSHSGLTSWYHVIKDIGKVVDVKTPPKI